MKSNVRSLRRAIRRIVIEAINQPYEEDLIDDDSFEEKSVYVPDDVKVAIKKWADSMKLTSR